MQPNNPTVQFNSRDEIMRAAMTNYVPLEQPSQSAPAPSNANIRAQFLAEVEKLVCTDRNVTHGDAEDNFRVIAQLWNVYIHNSKGEDLNNKDVAIMMCLFKISRLMSNVDNIDNWLDLAGYAACGGGIVKKAQ